MATRMRTIITDDLSGAEISAEEVTTETFTVDGCSYTIDLGPDSARAYAKALEPFRAAVQTTAQQHQPARRGNRPAQRSTGTGVTLRSVRAGSRGPATIDKEQRRAIRAWWAANWRQAGLPEPRAPRGAIPARVVEAFTANGGLKMSPARRGRQDTTSATG